MSLALPFSNVTEPPARFSHVRQPFSRVLARQEQLLAGALVLGIALIDLFFRNNYSLLYIAPLIVLAFARSLSSLRRTTFVVVILIYAIFFLKNAIFPLEGYGYIDFRLINRSFTALLMIAICKMLQMWIRWRDEQSDPELSEVMRSQNAEIGATFAILCCLPAVALIAAIDFLVPAHINLAILYPIPLFVCGWTRSRRLLWSMLAVLLALTLVAFLVGPPSTVVNLDYGLERQRILAVFAMLAVTVTLHVWMGQPEDRLDDRLL